MSVPLVALQFNFGPTWQGLAGGFMKTPEAVKQGLINSQPGAIAIIKEDVPPEKHLSMEAVYGLRPLVDNRFTKPIVYMSPFKTLRQHYWFFTQGINLPPYSRTQTAENGWRISGAGSLSYFIVNTVPWAKYLYSTARQTQYAAWTGWPTTTKLAWDILPYVREMIRATIMAAILSGALGSIEGNAYINRIMGSGVPMKGSVGENPHWHPGGVNVLGEEGDSMKDIFNRQESTHDTPFISPLH